MIINSSVVMCYHFDTVDSCLSAGLILAYLLDDRRCQMVMDKLMPPSVKELVAQRLSVG